MQFFLGKRAGRILCKPESKEDTDKLFCQCLSSHKNKNDEMWSVEDTLVNRVILGLDYRLNPPCSPSGFVIPAFPITVHELMNYQIPDVQKMLQLRAGLNANPMGYGKTIEAIAWLQNIGARRILIVCPKSVKAQWRKQLIEWFPEIKDRILISPKSFPTGQSKFGFAVITNYDQLINPKTAQAYRGIPWDAIVADECHRIRNPKAKTTMALKTLSCKNKFGLSGTPILNRPDNLWSIFHWINPWYFGGSYWEFVNAFCEVEETFWGKKIVGLTKNPKRQELLRHVLELVTIRNPKGLLEVQCFETPVVLPMYPKQKKLYKDVKKLAIDSLKESGITIANGMSQLIKLQQLTSNPALLDPECPNIKFEWIMDLVEDNPDTKLLVFSRFRETILALNKALEARNIKVATIHGLLGDSQRAEEKTKFLQDSAVQVLTGTIGALGEGVDELQHVCHDLVFIDKMWNPEENNQAIGRAYRNGQKLNVNVYSLVCEGSIDEKVGEVNVKKIEDIRAILDNAD